MASPAPDASGVTLTRADGANRSIVGRRDTWIIIHGLTGSKDQSGIKTLAAAVDAASTRDQVLVVDWRALARADVSGPTMEANAQAAANVVIARIRQIGLPTSRINVIGYSMGGLVAARVASGLRDRGGVNSIVALDPAAPTVGKTREGHVRRAAYELAANSKYSIAFHGQDPNSPLVRALSADDTIRLDDIGADAPARHAGVFEVFTRMTQRNNTAKPDAVSVVFSLRHISSGDVPQWRKDQFGMPGADGRGYEAVLTARGRAGSLAPDALAFAEKRTGQRRQVFSV